MRWVVGGGAREEGRKLLTRALALDPECVVAAGLFEDGLVPAPLVAGEVEFEAEPAGLVEVEGEGDGADASKAPAIVEVAVEAPRLARTLAALLKAEPPPPEVPGMAAEVAADEVPTTAAEVAAGEVPAATVPVAIEVPEEVRPAVPEWLARETPMAARVPGLHGLDPTMYAEWADLLGEEGDLDADVAERLREALAEATGSAGASAGWREVILDGASAIDETSQDGRATAAVVGLAPAAEGAVDGADAKPVVPGEPGASLESARARRRSARQPRWSGSWRRWARLSPRSRWMRRRTATAR